MQSAGDSPKAKEKRALSEFFLPTSLKRQKRLLQKVRSALSSWGLSSTKVRNISINLKGSGLLKHGLCAGVGLILNVVSMLHALAYWANESKFKNGVGMPILSYQQFSL